MSLVDTQPVLAALMALLGLGITFGAILGFASIRFRTEGNPLADQINQILPQTQCGQCGYPGCKPYAAAIAEGDVINKCPPGGQETIDALADLLDVESMTLDAEHGEEKAPKVAFIREAECIGCTKCIQAQPPPSTPNSTYCLFSFFRILIRCAFALSVMVIKVVIWIILKHI